MNRRHLMDTGALPDEIPGKSRNGSKLNSSRYPSISQEQKGRELIKTSYAENRRGTSEFEAWLK